MKLSPTQRKALFEKLKTSGKLKQNEASAPLMSPKMPKPPMAPTTPQAASTKVMTNPEKVNPNYIGNPRASRFKKIRNMFGI